MGTDSVINLHTHTHFSDGLFSPQKVIERAVQEGITHLAITDHFETSKVASLISTELDQYLSVINTLDRKFEGVIEVLAGVEIDTNPLRCDLESLPIEQMNDLDLVLLEYVDNPRFGGLGLEKLEDFISGLEVPCGMAHPDLSASFPECSPGELADLIHTYGLFVEINTAWPYKRDGNYFFECAEEYYREFDGRVKVSVGTDTHRVLSDISKFSIAYNFVERIGIEDALLF